MKQLIVLALAGAIGSAVAQPSVGVSIGINQPGVYGRIDIGALPPPALVVQEPVIVQHRHYVHQQAPIYLYVPTAYQQNWRAYCGRYNACSRQVYFVRDDWVRERYEHEHPGWNRGHHRGWDKKGDRHDDHGHGSEHGDQGKGGHD